MIIGYAKPEQTDTYFTKIFDIDQISRHSRWTSRGLRISSIGLGTHLGLANNKTDISYYTTILEAFKLGCNFIDTAPSYRFQRSERIVGKALTAVCQSGLLDRGQIVICSKAGFVAFDTRYPDRPAKWLQERLLDTGVACLDDFTPDYTHCMSSAYVKYMLDISLENLNLETIDIYYLHNPEVQRAFRTEHEFDTRIASSFETLERAVQQKKIRYYGISTWETLYVLPQNGGGISLRKFVHIARSIAGNAHHFRFIQLPINSEVGHAAERNALLEHAMDEGIDIIASNTLNKGRYQGKQLSLLEPSEINAIVLDRLRYGLIHDNVKSVLIGMSRPEHIKQNLSLLDRI